MINIYTDGSYKDSIKTGGHSAIIIQDDKIISKIYRGMKNTTNNRQELYGVIKGLNYFTNPTEIIIYSDSNYIVNTINNGYLNNWIKKSEEKKNMDLWIRIYKLINFHSVTFKWIKGHNNNKFNELADLYACHAADCINPLADRLDVDPY